jgi:hypothetical protein
MQAKTAKVHLDLKAIFVQIKGLEKPPRGLLVSGEGSLI